MSFEKSLLIFLMLVFATYWAPAKAEYVHSHTVASGILNISAMGGYSNLSLLNSDGTWATYGGQTYGGTLALVLIGNDAHGGLGFFGQYLAGNYTQAGTSPLLSLSRTEIYAGIRAYTISGFYGTCAYGWSNYIVSSPGVTNTPLKFNTLNFGIGWTFLHLSDYLSLYLEADYKEGIISKSTNSALLSNSALAGVDGFIGIRWTPGAQIKNVQ